MYVIRPVNIVRWILVDIGQYIDCNMLLLVLNEKLEFPNNFLTV